MGQFKDLNIVALEGVVTISKCNNCHFKVSIIFIVGVASILFLCDVACLYIHEKNLFFA